MPRGGARVGAGRKPKGRVAQRINGKRTKPELLKFPHQPGVPVQVDFGGKAAGEVAPIAPPDTLTDAERQVWQLLAGKATEAGTLTDVTAPAFADLCVAIARRDRYAVIIETDGPVQTDPKSGALKAHPLIVHYRGLMQRVEAAQMRFALTPMGKAIVKTDQPVDPFAQFEQFA